MKKYVIVNKRRFIVFVTLVIVFVTFVSTSLINNVLAKDIDSLKTIEVTIVEGDTLWEIAREYGNAKKDIREVIFDICELNDISANDIYPGQTIIVPCR